MSEIYETLVCGSCEADRRHALVGHNGIGKPVYRCTDCGERQVGPMGAREHRKLVQARQRAMTDGGRR
jgi:uncharacterized Zn finger protein